MTQTLISAAQSISPLLIGWAKGQPPSKEQKQQLIAWESRYLGRIWQASSQQLSGTESGDIESRNIESRSIEERAALLQRVVARLESSSQNAQNEPAEQNELAEQNESAKQTVLPLPGSWSDWIAMLWILWLPLAQQLDRKQKALGRPLVQGILGGQGTGKTTLCKMLRLVLAELDHETVPLSIDDLYLTYAQRQALLKTDDRLMWRGPPGTHDISLGIETVTAMRRAISGETVSVPQFDKSLYEGQGDRAAPLLCSAPTIILFEGWFVGATPLPPNRFDQGDLPAPIHTPADRQFAKDCNERLAQYQSLWNFLDALIVLCPRDYRLSVQWRQEAEQKMKASGKSGLSDDEIAAFVTYFWKALHPELFITPLTHSEKTDLVVYIEPDHSVGDLSAPAFGHSEKVNCV